MLTVNNLKKIYPKSDRVAVDGISFELRPGEIFGFLGQNGAGKSPPSSALPAYCLLTAAPSSVRLRYERKIPSKPK